MNFVPDTPYGEDAMNFTHLAAMIGLAESTLRCDYREMDIPHVRLAGRIIFLRPEIEQWMKKRAEAGYHHAIASANALKNLELRQQAEQQMQAARRS